MSSPEYQYESDVDGLAGIPDPTWVVADVHDGGSPLGLHDTTLFDENETVLGGEIYDLATGLPIDNSTDDGTGHLTILEAGTDSEIFGPNDPEADPEFYYERSLMLAKAFRNYRKQNN